MIPGERLFRQILSNHIHGPGLSRNHAKSAQKALTSLLRINRERDAQIVEKLIETGCGCRACELLEDAATTIRKRRS